MKLRRSDYLATKTIAHLFCNRDYSQAETESGEPVPNNPDAETKTILMANCLRDMLHFDDIKIHMDLDQAAIKSLLTDLI